MQLVFFTVVVVVIVCLYTVPTLIKVVFFFFFKNADLHQYKWEQIAQGSCFEKSDKKLLVKHNSEEK